MSTATNHQLFRLLRDIENWEVNKFTLFVKSGLFSKSTRAIKLLAYVKKYSPKFDSPRLEDEVIIHKLFKGKSTSYVRQAKSELASLLKEFLVIQEIQQKPRLKQRLFLNSMISRDKNQDYLKELHRARNDAKNEKKRGSDYYYHRAMLEDSWQEFYSNHPDEKEGISFREYLENLDKYTVIEKLKYICNAALWRKVYKGEKTTEEILFRESLIKKIHSGSLKEEPIIKLYSLVLQKFEEEDLTKLSQVFEPLLLEVWDKIPENDLKEIGNLVANLLLNRTGSDETYFAKLFAWYKNILLEYDLVKEGNYIPHQRFKNIVICALKLEKFNWVKNFINKHIEEVEKKHQKTLSIYLKGVTYYQNKEFEKARDELKQIFIQENLPSTFYFYNACTLLLRACFEVQDTYWLSQTNRKLVTRLKYDKQLSQEHLIPYSNFLSILMDLHTEMKKKSPDSSELTQKIENASLKKVHRTWLKAKIEALL